MWSMGTRAPPRSSPPRAQARKRPPTRATPSRYRALTGRPAPLPTVGARPRLPLEAMKLARRRDREADRRALTRRPDVVEVIRWHQDEVAGPRAHRLGLPLDLPVDLALDDEPPLVHQVVVAVVGMTGRLADQGGHDLLVDHDFLRPGRGPLRALDRVDPRVEVPRSEDPAHRRLCRLHVLDLLPKSCSRLATPSGLGYPTGRRSGRVVKGGRKACRAPTIASISPVVGSSRARPRSASASSSGRRSPGPRSRRSSSPSSAP